MKRAVLRWVLGALYGVAGWFHLTAPEPFLRIMPGWVPAPEAVVLLTGIAEFAGAVALVQWRSPALRKAGAIGLALYALCVWPANYQHFLLDMASADGGLGLGYHLPRLALQPLIIWAPLWAAGLTDWPFARRAPKR